MRLQMKVRGCHQVGESSNEEELSTEQQRPVDSTESRAAQNQPGKLGDSEAGICPQCCQQQCHTCKPGYMNLIVDMKEFSMTFAKEMRLCTLCEHQLCPGSALVVMLQCRADVHTKSVPVALKLWILWGRICACAVGARRCCKGLQQGLQPVMRTRYARKRSSRIEELHEKPGQESF
jgi:hypothetical protein